MDTSQSKEVSDVSNSSSYNGQGRTQFYFQSKLPQEFFCCLALYLVGVYTPVVVIRPIFGMNFRPAPYQLLKNSGDVVLDQTLSQPLIEDVTIPTHFLINTSIYLPLMILVLVTVFRPKRNPKYHDTHSIVCVMLLTIGMSEFITQMFKLYVGRLRPNFYALCGFDIESLSCTARESIQMEARSSFPSGHSSLCTAGMGVLVWFFLGRCFHQRYSNRKFCIMSSLAPLAYSTFVACSRLVDNWHHPSDIIAGICLGLFCPTVVYHMWYPSVFSENAGIPLSSPFHVAAESKEYTV